MSMSNLNHPHLRSSNVSTISSESTTSINSIGKKRRAPLPPRKPPPTVIMNQISEETPSMVHLENNNAKPTASSAASETYVKRVLPEVPMPPSNQVVPKSNDPTTVPKTEPPEPAPRVSLEAKIVEESPKKKKSAKKHKVPSTSSEQPQETSPASSPGPTLIESEQRPLSREQRPLSPDSALASSESSGSSLRKQGKLHEQQQGLLVRITPYEQFKPVIRKSAKMQAKIAMFSMAATSASGQLILQTKLQPSSTTVSDCSSRLFPRPRLQMQQRHLLGCAEPETEFQHPVDDKVLCIFEK